MSTRINTNSIALQAAYNLDVNSNNLNTDIERLSSGLQINSAADNPAGFVVAQSESAQIAGQTTATNNTNDAINEVKTADSALNEVNSLLVNIRHSLRLVVTCGNLCDSHSHDDHRNI